MNTTVKKLIQLSAIILIAFIFTGLRCEDEKNFVDPWMGNATLRCEGAGMGTIKFTDGRYLFYVDRGELFNSTRNKMGYASRDGATYYFVEWNGDFSVGSKSGAILRTQLGTVSLLSLEVAKSQGGIVWVAYKQDATSVEGHMVLEGL